MRAFMLDIDVVHHMSSFCGTCIEPSPTDDDDPSADAVVSNTVGMW